MEKHSCKFSVIMPVYNVEKYIHQSVDSVLNQSYRDFEIILVDDGAKDSCPTICDDYAKKDNRIKVIHKKNGGLSDARNFGIDKASGEYIIFLDSDDYWGSEKALEHIAEKIEQEKSDVLIFFFQYLFENENKIVEYNENYKTITIDRTDKATQLTDLIRNNVFISSAWAKVIRRELFLEHDLYFEKGIYSEDIEWSARLMLYAKSFSVVNDNFYIYIQRDSSIAHALRRKNIEDAEKNVFKALAMADKFDEGCRIAFMNYIAYQYITVLNVCCVCLDDISDILKEMKKHRYLLNYHWNSKVKKVYTFNRRLGFSLTMKLLKLYITKIR